MLDPVNDQHQTVSVDQVLRSFELGDDSLREIKGHLLREMDLGLKDEESATVKMLITYVRDLSRGDESGSYLALDLGGTHFRVLLVELMNGQAKVTSAVHDIPHELLITQQGQDLFDYVALKLLEFVQQYKLKRRRISLGFTFSFPCKQYGLTQSVLVKWCKGFRVGGVEGTDVVKQLKDALKRQLAGLVQAYVDVVAVINDTTGTLVACANSNPDCRIGLIVGTGFNACYLERLDRCEKWPANYTSPKQVIVNCEWGALGDNKQRRELDKFRNEFDHQVDAESVNPGSQTYEKMVSGMYIGELLRLSMLKLFKNRLLFKAMFDGQDAAATEPNQRTRSPSPARSPASCRGPRSASSVGSNVSLQNRICVSPNSTTSLESSHKLNVKNALDGKHLSMLGMDELGGTFTESTKVMQELNISQFEKSDLTIVIQLASKIMTRSAHLVGCGVSALLEKLERPFSVVGYDGSVIKYHPYFLKNVVQKCGQLTSKEHKFEFSLSSDGSGIGAAVVAAALHKERRPIYVVKPGKVYELHFSKPASSIGTNGG